MTERKTILVCGSRTWQDPDAVYMAIQLAARDLGPDHAIRIINGSALGADTMATAAAIDFGYEVNVFPARWDKHGKAAGPIRNRQMLDEQPDLVLAFGDGRGTNDTVREAKRRGIPVRRF